MVRHSFHRTAIQQRNDFACRAELGVRLGGPLTEVEGGVAGDSRSSTLVPGAPSEMIALPAPNQT